MEAKRATWTVWRPEFLTSRSKKNTNNKLQEFKQTMTNIDGTVEDQEGDEDGMETIKFTAVNVM